MAVLVHNQRNKGALLDLASSCLPPIAPWALWKHGPLSGIIFLGWLCVLSSLHGAPAQDIQSEATRLKDLASQVVRKMQGQYPEDPLVMMLVASLHYNNGQSSQAQPWLEKVLAQQPEMVDARLMLAKIAHERGLPQQCIDHCRLAMAGGAAPPAWFEMMLSAYMDLGRVDALLEELEDALRGVSLPPDAEFKLGTARMQLRQYALAREHFKRVVDALPEHTQAYFGLFMTSQRLGESEVAASYEKRFRELEEKDRSRMMVINRQEDELSGLDLVRDSTLKTLMAAAQVWQGRQALDDARQCYEQAIELNPDSMPIRLALENCLATSGQWEAGLKFFQNRLQEEQDPARDAFMLGRLYARQGDRDRAAAYYAQVIQLSPNWAAGYQAHAELNLLQNTSLDQAREYAAKAVELEPVAGHYYLLSVACIKQGDLRSALSAIQSAVRLKPQDARYGRLLQQLRSRADSLSNPQK